MNGSFFLDRLESSIIKDAPSGLAFDYYFCFSSSFAMLRDRFF